MTTEFQEAALGLQYVKRYHMRDTARTQNVAEHSFNMTMLVLETSLWLEKESGEFDSMRVYQRLLRALVHDLPEYLMGDLDYWVKSEKDLNVAWKSAEIEVVKNMLAPMPMYMFDLHTVLNYRDKSDLDYCIVKQADYLELTHFCFNDYLRGNKKSLEMARNGLTVTNIHYHDKLKSEDCPLRILERSLRKKISLSREKDVTHDLIG